MSAQAVWVNGRMVEPDHPHLRADDHGVIVGDGVFETLLVVPDGAGVAAFAVRRHLERLRRSARALRFECPYRDDELRAAIAQCLDAAPEAGIVRVTATSGGGPLGSGRSGARGSAIVIAGNRPPDYPPGTAVSTVPFPRNERGAMAGVKTTSYAENVLALDVVRERGASEAIFADTRGRVSEGTGSNIFWSDGARLHTPPLDTGCLAGVTRALLLERLDVTETHMPVEELLQRSRGLPGLLHPSGPVDRPHRRHRAAGGGRPPDGGRGQADGRSDGQRHRPVILVSHVLGAS